LALDTVTSIVAADTPHSPNCDHVGRLDFSAESVIIAGSQSWYLAAGVYRSLDTLHAGRLFSLDVTTPFEVQRKSRKKSRYSAAERWRVESKKAAAKQQSSKKAAARE
jgi:hypothetical protein